MDEPKTSFFTVRLLEFKGTWFLFGKHDGLEFKYRIKCVLWQKSFSVSHMAAAPCPEAVQLLLLTGV